jgi:hypothetical protein
VAAKRSHRAATAGNSKSSADLLTVERSMRPVLAGWLIEAATLHGCP